MRNLRPKLLGMDLTQAVLEHPYLVLGLFVLIEGPAATITAGTLVAPALRRSGRSG